MTHNKNKGMFKFKYIFMVVFASFFCMVSTKTFYGYAMPFYGLDGSGFTVRASFSTFYGNSSDERKWNVNLASQSINNFLLDVGAEFSFNSVVGERTEKRGYKQAKIIINGEFTDGIGGGVCQVSTTLYNAVLLAGLKITEYHPHSLAVNYVSPSFDAMVNSGSADLRFVNNTLLPIIINCIADGENLKIIVKGKKSSYTYEQVSEVVEEIPIEIKKVIDDGKYPELYVGQEKIVSFGKKGLVSKGYLIKYKNGKLVEKRLIRKDKYKPLNCVIVIGTTELEQENTPIEELKTKSLTL